MTRGWAKVARGLFYDNHLKTLGRDGIIGFLLVIGRSRDGCTLETSWRRLAAGTGWSYSTVRRCVLAAVKKSYLETEPIPGKGVRITIRNPLSVSHAETPTVSTYETPKPPGVSPYETRVLQGVETHIFLETSTPSTTSPASKAGKKGKKLPPTPAKRKQANLVTQIDDHWRGVFLHYTDEHYTAEIPRTKAHWKRFLSGTPKPIHKKNLMRAIVEHFEMVRRPPSEERWWANVSLTVEGFLRNLPKLQRWLDYSIFVETEGDREPKPQRPNLRIVAPAGDSAQP